MYLWLPLHCGSFVSKLLFVSNKWVFTSLNLNRLKFLYWLTAHFLLALTVSLLLSTITLDKKCHGNKLCTLHAVL